MAATYTVLFREAWGQQYATVVKLTPDTNWPAGGYAVTAQQLGLGSINGVCHAGSNATGLAYIAQYDATNSKISAFKGATEATGNTGYVFYLLCFGT